eukprot:13558009-Alexandrium_andersonii.AAC.1
MRSPRAGFLLFNVWRPCRNSIAAMLARFGLPAGAGRAAAALAVSVNGAESGARSSGDAVGCPCLLYTSDAADDM